MMVNGERKWQHETCLNVTENTIIRGRVECMGQDGWSRARMYDVFQGRAESLMWWDESDWSRI